DAWSRAAGRSVYEMYTGADMNQDLGWAGLPGRYPGDYLGEPRTTVPVQHALGVGDPLTEEEAEPGVRSLTNWMAAEGVTELKLKVKGIPRAEAGQIADVHRVERGNRDGVTLSIDPNKAYSSVAELEQMHDEHTALAHRAAASITYLEQPDAR